MPDPEPCPDLPDLDDAACQRALAVLLDVGTALALELKSPADDLTVVQRATAFPNVATAVRRTVILVRHIAATPRAAAPHAAASHAATPAASRTGARKHIIREVEDSIVQNADPADAGSLRLELLERLDAPEFETELAQRTPADLIAELCRDLGLANHPYAPPYARRTPDDIAILDAQAAAAPGAGLATWFPAAPRPPCPASLPTSGCPPS